MSELSLSAIRAAPCLAELAGPVPLGVPKAVNNSQGNL
jgi:hypothetical protein